MILIVLRFAESVKSKETLQSTMLGFLIKKQDAETSSA